MTKAEMAEVAKKDPWFMKLQAKRDELLAKPVPTPPQIKALWREVVKAYWRWITARLDKEERRERIIRIEGQMRLRIIELRKKLTQKKVSGIQRRLGYRFSPHMTSGAREAGAPPSATTI